MKADLGDFLYIIIAAVLMLAGGVEKYMKGKKKQQEEQKRQHQPQVESQPPKEHSEVRDVEEDELSDDEEYSQPQTLEEILKRMMQPNEVRRDKSEEIIVQTNEAQSLEVIPKEPIRGYQPIDMGEEKAMPEEEKESSWVEEYEFDLRKAVIAREILERRYT